MTIVCLFQDVGNCPASLSVESPIGGLNVEPLRFSRNIGNLRVSGEVDFNRAIASTIGRIPQTGAQRDDITPPLNFTPLLVIGAIAAVALIALAT